MGTGKGWPYSNVAQGVFAGPPAHVQTQDLTSSGVFAYLSPGQQAVCLSGLSHGASVCVSHAALVRYLGLRVWDLVMLESFSKKPACLQYHLLLLSESIC